MIRSHHQFLDETPWRPNDLYMILGTIHPHRVERFIIPYFYGNSNAFWKLLSEAFPEKAFGSVEDIKETLRSNHFFISDTMRACSRSDESVTADSKLCDVEVNRDVLYRALTETQISTIFFTSGFGKNGAARLFVDMFHLEIDYDKIRREFSIDASVFGRPLRGVILLSPSGAANKGIASSEAYKKSGYTKHYTRPVHQFKVDFYRKAFKDVFSSGN